jgi:uncharacterized repeat protein (TIGR01451 family)
VSICRAEELQITKTADRAAAEPGDSVVYRLLVRNLTEAPLEQVRVTDLLPLGFNFLHRSIHATIDDRPVAVTMRRDGATVILETVTPIPPGKAMAIVYAVLLTPEALRGTGLNAAHVVGVLPPGGGVPMARTISAGPATHQLRLRQGILSDTGTLVGRVFVDRDFDGEQGKGEPGIPNAVVVLDDGTRVTTDGNGLFTVQNVVCGYRTAVLDLTASPGYTLAPNRRFTERNSPSRMVRLAPGGMARVNFATMLTDEGRRTTNDPGVDRSTRPTTVAQTGRRGAGRDRHGIPQREPSVGGRWSVVVRLSPESVVQPGEETE